MLAENMDGVAKETKFYLASEITEQQAREILGNPSIEDKWLVTKVHHEIMVALEMNNMTLRQEYKPIMLPGESGFEDYKDWKESQKESIPLNRIIVQK